MSTGWFGRFVLSTECYRTKKLGYNNLNWPRCPARVTESLALTDGMFIPINESPQEIIDHYMLHKIAQRQSVHGNSLQYERPSPSRNPCRKTTYPFPWQLWLLPCSPHTRTMAPSMATDHLLPCHG